MATKAQVRDRVATKLGILILGGILQDKDKTRIESGYDEVYEELKEDGLAVWASTASVPTKLVKYMVDLVSFNCLDYGVSNDRYNRILFDAGDNGEKAKGKMRELISEKYESIEEPTDF